MKLNDSMNRIISMAFLGGKGNHYFLSNINRAPIEFELGAQGDKKSYKLELRLISHFGLVRDLFVFAIFLLF